MTNLTFEQIKETLEAEAIKDADVLDLAKSFEDLRDGEENLGHRLARQIGEGDLFALVGDPDHQPIRDKFAGNRADLTAEEHKRCVEAFLAGGPDSPNPEGDCPLPPYPNGTPRAPGCGKITRLDRGASSGLASEVQRQNIRFGKNPQPFRRA